MADDSVARKIQRKLRESLSEHITVGAGDDAIYLSGHVRSRAERQLAEEIARSLADDVGIENNLAVERVLPDDRIEIYSPDLGEGNLYEDFGEEARSDGILPLEVDDAPVDDEGEEAEENEEDDSGLEDESSYFPPTDPVLVAGTNEIQGGFSATSLDDMQFERSAEDNLPGDEALVDAVRQALADDAATTDLQIEVTVERGVAHLRGRVTDLVDAENAEGVASEVPGIREVVDETTVEYS